MRGESIRCAAVNADDPPDLVVTWENGDKWGVEVTRTYQQVAPFVEGEPVSSEGIIAPLRIFAEQLGEKTQDIRKRGYTLCLEGPGQFSSWKNLGSKNKWQQETEKTIRKHIVSEDSHILKVPGVWLKPGEPGKRWSIAVGHGAAEISAATATMVWHALEDKKKKLTNWNGVFAERWLLLLNCYPFADDLAEVQDTRRQLVCGNQESVGFKGIFWGGYSDRKLTPFSLS